MKPINKNNIQLTISAGRRDQIIQDGRCQIAFSGRSNVGKSSLVNSLLGRKKLARVSSEPGKTITVNCYDVDGKLWLVDLPGYGFARRPKNEIQKWSSLTEGYFYDNHALKLVLQLVDCKVGLTSDDVSMLQYMDHFGVPYMLVATKCDKLNKTELQKSVEKILKHPALRPGTEIILYSSAKDLGREQLWTRILRSAADV